MRASFFYGNYDGLSQLPKFDLYFGDSLWKTVNFTDENTYTTIDSIHVTSDNQVQICLVNTNTGTPFISSLEFRPLPNETYKFLTRSLLLYYRLDMGTTTNETYRLVPKKQYFAHKCDIILITILMILLKTMCQLLSPGFLVIYMIDFGRLSIGTSGQA